VPGGYAWWYLDGLSDDGLFGITVIAFLGSVFSPYYATARRRGVADPEDHVCFNVCLYGPRANRWAMNERRRRSLTRDRQHYGVGASGLSWDGSTLSVTFDERGAPLPYRLKGRIRFMPAAVTAQAFDLTPDGGHRWWPIAPSGRMEVDLQEPGLRWQGSGYLDSNAGDGAIEDAFYRWDWSRAPLPGPSGPTAAILYDGHRRAADGRQGDAFSLALTVGDDGGIEKMPAPTRVSLPGTFWRIDRTTQVDPGHGATVVRTLEDTPFYARSELRTQLFGRTVTAMHESLSLDRFRSPVVQAMLRFRMPRSLG